MGRLDRRDVEILVGSSLRTLEDRNNSIAQLLFIGGSELLVTRVPDCGRARGNVVAKKAIVNALPTSVYSGRRATGEAYPVEQGSSGHSSPSKGIRLLGFQVFDNLLLLTEEGKQAKDSVVQAVCRELRWQEPGNASINGGIDELLLVCKSSRAYCGDHSVLSIEGLLQVVTGKVGLADGDAGREGRDTGGASQDGDIEVLGFHKARKNDIANAAAGLLQLACVYRLLGRPLTPTMAMFFNGEVIVAVKL